MIIQREMKTGDFHVARDDTFQDESLSWEARGVLAYLFSKPEDWTPRMYDLVQKGPCKKHKIKSIFQELEEHGYMKREKYRTEDGTFDWQVTVSDHPQFDPGWTESTPDDVHPEEDRGYNNTDNQSDGQSTIKKDRRAFARAGSGNNSARARAQSSISPPARERSEKDRPPDEDGEEENLHREDDPPGITAWIESTGERPSLGTKQTLRQMFTGASSPDYHHEVFRKTVKEAYLNVDGKAHRIGLGYLLSSYERRLSRRVQSTDDGKRKGHPEPGAEYNPRGYRIQ